RRGGDDHPGRRRDGQGPRRGRASLTTFRGPPLDDEPGIGALTLGGLLVETCARHGGREALVFHAAGGVVRWTYDDLLREVRTTARALLANGVDKGSRVAVLMGNRPEWVAAAFAVTMAGAVVVPVNTYFEPPELAHVLRHSDCGALLAQEQLLSHDYLDQVDALRPELPYLRLVVGLDVEREHAGVLRWESFLES